MTEKAGLAYGLEDRPKFGIGLLFGLQWLVLFLPLVVITSALFTRSAGLDQAASLAFYTKTLIVCGLAMTIQPLIGHRLPLVDGPAAVLLLTSINLVGLGLDVVAGGMIVGGLLLFAVAVFRLHRPLIRLFTPNVVAAVLLLIAVTLTPLLAPLFMGRSGAPPRMDLFGVVLTPTGRLLDAWHTVLKGDPVSAMLALGLCLVTAMAGFRLRGVWRSMSLFIGIALGMGVMALLGRVDWSPIYGSAWLALPGGGFFSPVSFRLSAILAFVVSYVALIINQVGSITSVQAMVEADDIPARTRRSLGLNGCFGALAGWLGIVGPVSYSLSPGVIKVTGVGSRWPVAVAGVMCLAMAFSPLAAGLMAAVPGAVVAAALLVAMAGQLHVALDILTENGQVTTRRMTVVGVPTMIGLVVSLMPASFWEMIPAELRGLAGNGLVMGVLVALLLEHVLIPGRDVSRGRNLVD